MRLSKFEQANHLSPPSRSIVISISAFLSRSLLRTPYSCFWVFPTFPPSMCPRNVPAGVTAGDDEGFPTLRVHRLKVAWHAFCPCIPQNSWTALTTGWSYRCGSPVRLGGMMISGLEAYVRERGIYSSTALIPSF